ncbi:MAG: hypothetical protein FJ255_01660 [Phycisphaerae bacterium]|nr:hypothetical protein [Phycisphaerae bacterium]
MLRGNRWWARRVVPGLTTLALAPILCAQGPAPDPKSPPPDHAATDRDDPRDITLWLRGGQRLAGTLVELSDTLIVVSIGGVRATFARDGVERFEVGRPVSELYAELRDATDPADADALVRLAEWLRARKRLELALAETNRALMAEPTHARARELRTIIEEQVKLLAVAPKPEAPPAPAPRPADEFPLLDDRQINLVRVYEVDLSSPPRLAIAPDLIARLIETYQGDPLIPSTRAGRDLLFSMRPDQVLELMFKLRARDLYDQVQVLEHPRSIRLFRDDVHRGWLLSACASNDCHGGTHAGRLQLTAQRPGTSASVYTNLYILDRYRTRDGSPLVDYDQPARSPLVQAGFPREQSSAPHPKVDGWRPVFRAGDDPRLQRTIEWIRAMYHPRPDYGVDYTPRAPFHPDDAATGPQPQPGR